MRKKAILIGLLAFTFVAVRGDVPAKANAASQIGRILTQDFELGGMRTPDTRYFRMTTTWVSCEPNGGRGETETFEATLKCVSQGDASKVGDQYTCRRFVYVKPDGTQVDIPALEGWTYTFKKTETGFDEKGRVFGIDHAKFDQLIDSRGDPLSPSKSYLIYNSFIDFHGFCDLFPTPVADGQGIQHLTRIGQKIVHAAAHTAPPTNLGGNIKKGSHFKNGEITLTLKGLGVAGDVPCAVVEFDSGASSFRMLMEPILGMEITSVGSSHYFGDIYIDLATRWALKVDMRELVVSETKVPTQGTQNPMVINSVQERKTSINAISKEAFEKQ